MATKLISSKPEELRAYIEEVAGISIYRERKKETESRIKKTRENLKRVSDIKDEIEKTLIKLNQQVKSAEKYNFLKEKEKKFNGLLKAFNWQARNEAASKLDLSVKQTELEIQKLQTEKQTLSSSIEIFRTQQIDLQSEIDSIQQDFYSSGANLSKSEQQLVFLKDKRNQLNVEIAAQKENRQNILNKKTALAKEIEILSADLIQKEPQLEKMDASISKLDGAMSPVFILKQIIIEQSNLMNSVKDFQFNFDSKSSQDLEPIIDDLKKFEDKLSQLNEILEKQEDYQEEKFLAQKNDLLSLSGEITSLKVNIATLSRDIASLDEQEQLSKDTFESNSNQLLELENPILELEKDMKPLLDSRANVEDDLSSKRSKYADISEQIRTNERRTHEVDISIEQIRTNSQDSKVTRQGYLSEAEIYLKQLEKDSFILEDLLQELNNDCLLYTSPSPRDRG